jgi:hypothetical protein
MNQRRGDAEQYAAPPPFIGSGIRQDLTSHNRQPKVHSGQIVGAEDFLPPYHVHSKRNVGAEDFLPLKIIIGTIFRQSASI